MELNLHPIATKCCVSGREFAEQDRVVCYLVREDGGLAGRRDVLESEDGKFPLPVEIYCRWVVSYKPRPAGENPERALKLTAENLFLTLADPANPPSAGNTPLLQFLALMLERKKLIKPRGLSEDGQRQVYEHMPSHLVYEVPVGNLDEAFFARIQEQLGVLVGTPKPKTAVATEQPVAG
jgi:hypothetical protein